jgi:hypothetical protein
MFRHHTTLCSPHPRRGVASIMPGRRRPKRQHRKPPSCTRPRVQSATPTHTNHTLHVRHTTQKLFRIAAYVHACRRFPKWQVGGSHIKYCILVRPIHMKQYFSLDLLYMVGVLVRARLCLWSCAMPSAPHCSDHRPVPSRVQFRCNNFCKRTVDSPSY